MQKEKYTYPTCKRITYESVIIPEELDEELAANVALSVCLSLGVLSIPLTSIDAVLATLYTYLFLCLMLWNHFSYSSVGRYAAVRRSIFHGLNIIASGCIVIFGGCNDRTLTFTPFNFVGVVSIVMSVMVLILASQSKTRKWMAPIAAVLFCLPWLTLVAPVSLGSGTNINAVRTNEVTTMNDDGNAPLSKV